jgi:hypothetical protein
MYNFHVCAMCRYRQEVHMMCLLLQLHRTVRTQTTLGNCHPLKRFKYLSRKLTSCNNSTEDTDIVCEAVDINTELQYYSAELKKIGVLNANNALQFWLDRHSTYPLLSLLAEDLVSAPASQAYVERIFSVCGELTAAKRNRTRVTLALRVFLKLNGPVLDMIDDL